MKINFKPLLVMALGMFCTGAFAGWSNSTVTDVRVVKADDGREICVFINGSGNSYGFEVESIGDSKMADLLIEANKTTASIWYFVVGSTLPFNQGGSSYYTTVNQINGVALP